MTHVSAPLKGAFILPALNSPTCSKSRMPTTWSALDTSPRHFARKPPSWFRSSTVSMWQFRIMEPRLLRFAFMKQCCNSPSQTDEGGTSLPPSSTKSSIKLLSASFAALPHETAHDFEHASSCRFSSQDQRLPRLDGLAKLQIANIGNSPPTLSDFS